MNKVPKISVCIATYNGEKYIEDQITSILSQSILPDEIIISDDNSIDKTIEIIKNIKSPIIKIVKNSGKGIISNFETSLKNATGDYIFLCDQDDIWDTKKIEIVKNQLKNYSLVVHDAYIWNCFDNTFGEKTFFEITKSKKGFWRNLYKNSYIGCCMAFRKEILKEVLPFPNNIPMHDSWIGLNSELKGDVLFLKSNLIKYRRHGNNASQTTEKSKNSLMVKIRDRVFLLFSIIKKEFAKNE